MGQFVCDGTCAGNGLGDCVPGDHKPYSTAPCAKCGAFKVRCTLEDESDGCGTYYDIECEACGHAYRTDGPDS